MGEGAEDGGPDGGRRTISFPRGMFTGIGFPLPLGPKTIRRISIKESTVYLELQHLFIVLDRSQEKLSNGGIYIFLA